MLLTVIAVATLLVAVVGATFAYFSLTVSGEQTATATVQTAKIPAITLDGGDETLSMFLTAEDMVQGEAAKSYFAVKAAMTEGESQKATAKQNHTIATLTSTGGVATDSYKCILDITVTKSGAMELTSGDAKLYLSGLGITTEDVPEEGLDLSTVTGTKSFASKEVTINGDADSKTLTADVEFINTMSSQNSLAGKDLKVTISTSLKSCTLVTD